MPLNLSSISMPVNRQIVDVDTGILSEEWALFLPKLVSQLNLAVAEFGNLPTYAPTDAEYIVSSANAALTSERVATDTATIDYDAGTAGQAKWNVLEVPGIASAGIVARTAAATYAARSLSQPAAGLTISNSDGVSGNPTFALADDLAALEGMSGTGLVARTASNTYAQRTITGTANEITIANGNGISGNPTASLPTALTFTGKTVTGGGFTNPTLTNATTAAGTTSIPAIQHTAGSNLTTPAAGAREYDGSVFYNTPVASNRAVDVSTHFLSISANQTGSNVNTAQPWFPGGGATGLTVAASTTYLFEGFLVFTKTAGVSARTVGLNFGGTATITSIFYDAIARTEDAASPTLGAASFLPIAVATNTTVTASSASANQSVSIRVKGLVRINASGTFIPNFQYSAAPGGAPTIRANSWFSMTPWWSSSVLSVGNWS